MNSDEVNLEIAAAEFVLLKAMLKSEEWPDAVNTYLICDKDSESDKEERAIGILELLIDEELTGKKFLDMGCGEGHCVKQASVKGSSLSMGYDPVPDSHWLSFAYEDCIFSNDFLKVVESGPYDIILIFDVIDHLVSESPVEFLLKAKSVLAPGGKIYLRTHPVTSRHATHSYRTVNKAFIHLVFTPEELAEITSDVMVNNGETRPLASYDRFIAEAGLVKVSQNEIKEDAEEFFIKNSLIAERIKKNTKFDDFPVFQTSLQFVDFVLEL